MKKRQKIISIGAIALIALLLGAGTLQVTANIGLRSEKINKMRFYPSDDATVHADGADANVGSVDNLKARNNYGAGRSTGWANNLLIKFDSLRLPRGANVVSATLNLYYYKYKDSNPAGRTLTLRSITSKWSEETVTWNTKPSCSEYVVSKSIVPMKTGARMSFDVTEDVRKKVQVPESNHGWQITDEKYWGRGNIPIIYFRSKEYSEDSGRFIPHLEIEYTISTISKDMTRDTSTLLGR
jgi:hypothetical protein